MVDWLPVKRRRLQATFTTTSTVKHWWRQRLLRMAALRMRGVPSGMRGLEPPGQDGSRVAAGMDATPAPGQAMGGVQPSSKKRRGAHRASARPRKRALWQQRSNDAVPDAELPQLEDSEGPMYMFSRFFGFRKRGSSHHPSSAGF